MAIDTSGPIIDENRADDDNDNGNDVAGVVLSSVEDSTASVAVTSPKEKAMSVATEEGIPNNSNAEGVNESQGDSIDEENPSPINENDFDNNQVQAQSSVCQSRNVDNNINIENENEGNQQSDSDSDPDESSNNSSGDESDSDSDSDDDSQKPGDGISAYERLRIERIRRNEERLKQLGLVDPNKKKIPPKKKNRVSLGGGAGSKESDAPTRSQPRRSAKKKMIHGELLSGGQIDLRRSGRALTQSYKNRSGPQKQAKAMVEKNRYSKRYHCGECRACKRQTDCQTCYFCCRNKRLDPSSTGRRRCLFRTCLRRLVDVEEEPDVKTEAEESLNVKTEATTEAPTVVIADGVAATGVDNTSNKDDKAGPEPDAEEHAKEKIKPETPNTETVLGVAATEIGNDTVKNGNFDGVQNDDRGEGVGECESIVTPEVDTNADTKVDGDNETQEQKSDPSKADADDEPSSSAMNSVCVKEESESAIKGQKASCNQKISIWNSEYFASYRMEEDKSGMPKWLDEFQNFLLTIPHGQQNRVAGEKNTIHTMGQVCKLVSGEGITYHLWPEGIYFKKGIKIHLGMNLKVLHDEACLMELRYKDLRKGSLLRHPIAKIMCYKEWIADGKASAVKEPPMSPLMALPPPKTDTISSNKGGDDEPRPKKGTIAVTIEDRIKPNRIKWDLDTIDISADVGAEEIDIADNNTESAIANSHVKNTTNKNIQDENRQNDATTIDVKIESSLMNEDKKTTTNAKNDESADGIAVKPDTVVSQGDDKENSKESLSNISGTFENKTTVKNTGSADEIVVKSESIFSEGDDKENNKESLSNMNGATKSSDDAIKNASTNAVAPTINGKSNTDTSKLMPSCCAVCSEDGCLICCDGCNRGYHSNCHLPKIKEIPTGDWLCRECKRKELPQKPQKPKSSGGPKRAVVLNLKLFHGEHDDDCYMCYLGGDLICCDFCEKAFHSACHIPPLPFIPEGIWKCCECLAVERKKKSRCGECKACTRDDCGKCKHCLDKPKFGGINKLKQVCMKKVCPYPRFAPPASSTTVCGVITGKASTNKATPTKSPPEPKHIPSTGKKRGRPRKSVDGDNEHLNGTGVKCGRPSKSITNDNLPVNGTGKKRGRPRKSVDGDKNDITTIGKKRGRPRKSVDGDNLPMNDITTIGEKRGRPRKSVDSDERLTSKRVKIEAANEEILDEPVIFRFKISSFKSVYKDPESIKIRRIIKTAIRDPSDSKIVDKACEQLRKCMKSVESVKTAILFGGVEMVCNAMRDHPDKSMLQAESCCTIAEMLWTFPGISTKLAHMGAIDLIVTSIHNCPKNFKVQQMGCGALGALSYDANSIQHIINADGLRAVVAAMERFPKKLAVQKEGCYFFQNLIVRSIDALSAVSNSQVVSIIVEAMSGASSDTEFLLSVCGLIANLAVNKDAKGFIGKSDAIPSLISVLHTNDDIEVKQAACTALKNLASGSSNNQTKILEKQGLDALFGAIRSHPNDPLLLVLSFNVMKELCMNDEDVGHQIVKKGGIKMILKAMEKNHNLATMQVAACEVIGYLLLKGKSEIHAPKLVNAIITAMKNHSEAFDVQIQACDALFELSQIPTTRLILKKKETQKLLLRAKSHFKPCESDVDDIIAASQK